MASRGPRGRQPGRHVGQVLASTDLLGIGGESYKPSTQYADLDTVVVDAVADYVGDVEDGSFPAPENVYDPVDGG